MKKNSLLFFTVLAVFVLIGMIGGSGCANIIPPTGGPRDSLPPVLMTVTPRDSALGFNAKRISFNFNEYVQLDDVQKNLMVSPVPKINPTVESKLRVVTVTLRDTLEANTTYSINFGNAIKDVNEGNPLKEFTYTFTTGQALDSLMINGRVLIAETGKPDSTLVAVLHTVFADSALKERPRYAARLDQQGRFTFRNLPPQTYAIYAFKDESGSRRYTSPQQLFAFADTLVSSVTPPDSLVLYAYLEKDTAQPIQRRQATVAKPVLKGNAALADRLLKIEPGISGNTMGLLASDTMHLRFPKDPLRSFDSTKIVFANENFEPITNYRLQLDTSGKRLDIFHAWTPNTGYNLVFDKDFAEDTSGRKIPRNDTLTFRTKKETDYGLVRIRFIGLDLSRNPVLQFVKSNEVVFSHVFGNSRDFFARLFDPGEYELRILFDENQNGKWDPGDFFKTRKQPEKVMPLERKANIRGNIDNDFEIRL